MQQLLDATGGSPNVVHLIIYASQIFGCQSEAFIWCSKNKLNYQKNTFQALFGLLGVDEYKEREKFLKVHDFS